MPKSKPRKDQKKSGKSAGYGANIGKTSSRANLMASVVAVATLLAVGAYWWGNNQRNAEAEKEAAGLALEGQAVLAQVRTIPGQGNGHLSAGETRNYVEPFPTSGDHAAIPTRPGFYDRELPKINLVHALEHGSVVIYYENPGEAAMARLKDWTSLYDGTWDGVVATLATGLGEVVVMTAWTKLLRLEAFDEASAAAFIDQYRGRGPENPVR